MEDATAKIEQLLKEEISEIIIEKVDFMDFREALLKHSEKKKIVGQAGLNGRVIYRLIKEE